MGRVEVLRRSALPLCRCSPPPAHCVMATILNNALLANGSLADIRIEKGLVATIAPAGTLAAVSTDLAGALLVPGFIDGHIHLDKTLFGLPFQRHRPGGTVAERIVREKELRRELHYPVEERAKHLITRVVAWGTTALRTHVDIDTEVA